MDPGKCYKYRQTYHRLSLRVRGVLEFSYWLTISKSMNYHLMSAHLRFTCKATFTIDISNLNLILKLGQLVR